MCQNGPYRQVAKALQDASTSHSFGLEWASDTSSSVNTRNGPK